MAKRRANHEGTIFKKSDGKWRAQITQQGRRLSYTGANQKECQAWVQRIRGEMSTGLTFKGLDIRLDEYLTDWLAMVATSRTKSTYNHYCWIVEKRILPFLGTLTLEELKTENVQNFYRVLLRNGSSAHQVLIVHKILRVALNHAVKLGYIGRNPCMGTTPPRPGQKEMKFYNDQQVKVLLDTAMETENRFFALCYLAVHTGMRESELLGLQWKDIDWSKKTLKVARQALHLKGGGFGFTAPKSRSGIRKVILGDKAVEVLKVHRAEIQQLRSEAGESWTDLDLVFPSLVGTPLAPCNLRRAFRRLIDSSGLPMIRFHDLRHTAASLMLNHGIPVLIASKRLGHSKASITMDVYGHLMPNKQEEAAALLDRLLNPE